MKKLLGIMLMSFLLSISIAFAQEANITTDLCKDVVCSAITQTCTDGFAATCTPVCDPATGACGTCTPDCTGHDLVVGGPCAGVNCGVTTAVCPDGVEVKCINPCDPDTGCGACIPDCTGHELAEEKVCVGKGGETWAVEPNCCPGLKVVSDCLPDQPCPVSLRYCVDCGNGICEAHENWYNCPEDCPKPEEVPTVTPVEVLPVAPENIPKGCRQEVDKTGATHIVCEAIKECPIIPEEEIIKCKENNGVPKINIDSRGCKYYECRYQEASSHGFIEPVRCPTKDERAEISRKCEEMGMKPIMKKDFNGCLIVDCSKERREITERKCPSDEEIIIMKNDCIEKGGKIVPGYDKSGCETPLCVPPEGIKECAPPPKEAFERCKEDGGELIIRQDERGCPTYVKCVKRGDEREIEYEEVEEVPSSSKLLSVALKLESLKMDFDKLARETNSIADYYGSVGESTEEERFRRVSSMFEGAKNKIDDIKNKMRERLDSLTIKDISEFKHDLKYINEIVIKDILYVMLSTELTTEIPITEKGVEVKKTEEGFVNCGRDESCFNKKLRVCEKAIFYAPGMPEAKGPEVKIVGLEDKKCVIKILLEDEPSEKSYDMVCKYPNYVMGLEKPEQLIQYCEGSLVEFVKTQATITSKVAPVREYAKPKEYVSEELKEYVVPRPAFLDEIEKLGPATLIDFETLPDGSALQSGDRLTGNEWESLGVIFEFPSEDYLQVFGLMYPFNPLDSLSLSPGLGPFEAGGDTHDDLNIIFSEPVKAAGIYLLDLGETDERESITFLDKDGNIIERISPWPKSTFGNPAPGTFVGLTHEDGISKIQILENTGDSDDIAYDNLYFVR